MRRLSQDPGVRSFEIAFRVPNEKRDLSTQSRFAFCEGRIFSHALQRAAPTLDFRKVFLRPFRLLIPCPIKPVTIAMIILVASLTHNLNPMVKMY